MTILSALRRLFLGDKPKPRPQPHGALPGRWPSVEEQQAMPLEKLRELYPGRSDEFLKEIAISRDLGARLTLSPNAAERMGRLESASIATSAIHMRIRRMIGEEKQPNVHIALTLIGRRESTGARVWKMRLIRDGKSGNARVESDMGDNQLRDCVVEALSGLQPPREGSFEERSVEEVLEEAAKSSPPHDEAEAD